MSLRITITYREHQAGLERPTGSSAFVCCYPVRAWRPFQFLKLTLPSCYTCSCYTVKESESEANRFSTREHSQRLALTSSKLLDLEPIPQYFIIKFVVRAL